MGHGSGPGKLKYHLLAPSLQVPFYNSMLFSHHFVSSYLVERRNIKASILCLLLQEDHFYFLPASTHLVVY